MSALDKAVECLLLRDIHSDWGYWFDARAELAQLRSQVAEQRDRIAWLTSDIGESGLAAINRLIAACERGDIPQQYAPDLSITRDEILRNASDLQAAQH